MGEENSIAVTDRQSDPWGQKSRTINQLSDALNKGSFDSRRLQLARRIRSSSRIGRLQ